MFVLGAFVRDAVCRHVSINLGHLRVVATKALIAATPTRSETSLRVKKTAPIDVVRRAEYDAEQDAATRKAITEHLHSAATDIDVLAKLIAKHKSATRHVLGLFGGLILRISPFALFTWISTQLTALPALPLWYGIGLCVTWMIAYHLIGVIGIPLHDAEYRKYLLFEGYIGSPEDGVCPLFPNVSRLEQELYEHLKIAPPIVVSWETLIPVVHDVFIILIVAASFWLLPLDGRARVIVLVVGTLIVGLRIRHIRNWRRLIAQRYPGRSLVQLVMALLTEYETVGPSGTSDIDDSKH
jgi:hypothetical protein